MTERMTGTVKAVTKDGKGFLLEEEEGRWYRCFSAAQMKATRGDSVDFNYDEVVKGSNVYYNVKGSVRVIGTSARPTESSRSSSTGESRIPMGLLPVQLARERAIIRQNALTSAVNYCNGNPDNYEVHDVMEIARAFESYTSGDLDIENAAKSKDVESKATYDEEDNFGPEESD